MIDTSSRVSDQKSAEEASRKIERSLITRLRLAVSKPILRQMRGMTLGSRVAVVDDDGRFLLVKQTYAPGWIFPGGGVERGETCVQSALRELQEEAAVTVIGELGLRGIYSNHRSFPGDHLLFYVCRNYRRGEFKPNLEIAGAEFFKADTLPEKVEGGSRRRIAEMVSGAPPSLEW